MFYVAILEIEECLLIPKQSFIVKFLNIYWLCYIIA